MGKLTWRGPVPPDDPMFSGGVEIFTPFRVNRTSVKAEDSEAEAPPGCAEPHDETAEDEKRVDALRVARWQHQNRQMADQGKPKKR